MQNPFQTTSFQITQPHQKCLHKPMEHSQNNVTNIRYRL